jgi:hypothetical protein
MLVLGATIFAPAVLSQNFSTDARRIGMGGVGNQSNLASELVEEQQPYRSIPIPLGLFQVLRNLDVFDPGSTEFDPLRAVENLSNPIHISFDRDASGPGNVLVRDIVNGGLSRDLNSYRGFVPESEVNAQGLWAPRWGRTFRVAGDSDTGSSHGVFAGAGPYVSLGTNVMIDQNLIDIFSSSTNVYRPNTTFQIDDVTTGQGAMAITGGYRGRLVVFDSVQPGGASSDGVYIAGNYHHLRGIHYDTVDMDVRFDTDAAGQVTLAPTTTPISIARTNAKKGAGFAIDLGTAVLFNGWNVNFGANGIGNRITWESLRSEQLVLQSLFQGGNFIRTPLPAPQGDRRISLPVHYSGGGGYSTDRWSAQTEISHGLQDFSIRGGAEYRLGPLAVRGGSRYQLDRWHASTGAGINLTNRIGVDMALFETTSNIERDRRWSMALSLRLNRAEN